MNEWPMQCNGVKFTIEKSVQQLTLCFDLKICTKPPKQQAEHASHFANSYQTSDFWT